MNWRVYILAVATFAVGLVELIVGGILPEIANGLNITIAQAGQLTTVFALVYAISAPVLLSLTAKIERKRLYLCALLIFSLANFLTYFSTSFALVMAARALTAMSAALVTVLSITIASKIVESHHRAKAIGLIFMGVSSSLVLGVPIGRFITDYFGWRNVFLGIGLLSLISMILITFLLNKMPVEAVIPLKQQIKSLRKLKIISAHLITLFMLAGHYMLYAYLTPFLMDELNMSSLWISVCYVIIGVGSIIGNIVGGWLSDSMGSRKSILLVTITFAVVLFLIPYTMLYLPLFLMNLILWGALSWALTPSLQNYLIQSDPETSDIQQSLNTSALQVGISCGSGLGAIIYTLSESTLSLAAYGALLVVLSIGCALISLRSAS